MTPRLQVEDLFVGYGEQAVVQGLSLSVAEGDLVCLLGPSGCGKTTVLRAIAGFEPVTRGEIRLAGSVVSSPGFLLPPERRHIGMVFQDYALFPHLPVAGNVQFGMAARSAAERARLTTELLALVGLEGLGGRFPHELSGGQQQRVALARALASGPSLVLLDEPFSSLDVDLRARVSAEVRDILKARGITGVLVTHDQHEAFALGDRIGVMQDGRLLQWDTAYNLYHQPADRFVADFIGQGVLLRGEGMGDGAVRTELGVIRGRQRDAFPAGTSLDVLLRPDDVVPDPGGPLRAEVVRKAFQGAEIMYTLRLPTGTSVLAMFPSHRDHALGELVGIRVVADHLVAFPAGSARAHPDQ
ncbi:MAG: ABC transporter ATP-binding protein [Gammaproteobacteria bacterium]|jgi:iron(III) transport system ATP-binding protein|nr:ABC transporter ATP-binding protein [Gammaproteobacteria bacterium]